MGAEPQPARESRASRPTVAQRTTRLPRLDRLLQDGLQPRITAAAVAGGVVMAAVIGLLLHLAGRAIVRIERAHYSQLATDARVRLDQVANRDRARLIEAAFSDELYFRLGESAAPDSAFRPSFVQRFRIQHGDRLVAVYDLSGRRLVVSAEPGSEKLESAVATGALFRMLDNREPTVGLLRDGEELFWVGGAPVLPTNYGDASQPIRGYLVIAQPFGSGALVPSERGGRIELSSLAPSGTPFRTRVGEAPSGGDSVQVEFAIADIFAKQTTLAGLVIGRGEFRAALGTVRVLALVGIVLAGLLAAAAWFAITRTLLTPAVNLSTALAPIHAGQIPGLIPASSSAKEWSTVTAAVNRLLAHGRVAAERFLRLTTAVRDGAWERDLTSGEWHLTARLKKQLAVSDGEPASLVSVLEPRLHPDDRDRVLPWLQSTAPVPPALSGEIRIRRSAREAGWTWYRLDGNVATDLGGAPVRLTGRLVDITAERAAEAGVAEAEAAREEIIRRHGVFLRGLAAQWGASAELGRQLDWVGRGLSGAVSPEPEDFDLHSLLQEVSARSDLGAALTLAPGVPTRVRGDRGLVREVLERAVEMVGAEGRLALRAEQPDRRDPEVIRLVVELQGDPLPGLDELRGVLETGEGGGPDPRLAGRMVYHLSRALGGRASAERDGPATRIWFAARLPAVAAEPEPAAVDFGSEAAASWETASSADATFEPEPAPTAALPKGAGARTSGPVELVADATVVIRLDDANPVAAPPVSNRIRAALLAQESGAVRSARIAVADTPLRLIELRDAVRAGEARQVASIVLGIRAIADALEAKRMADRCGDILDAVESQYLEVADDLVTGLEHAWDDVRAVIEPFGQSGADAAGAAAAIESAALEQLTATMTPDGLGLGNQLVSLFLAEAPTRLEAASRASDRGDLAALRSNLTDLKGMCGLVGAKTLAGQCAALATDPTPPDPAARIARLRTQFREVQDVLEPLLEVRAGA
jgi:PAS domain-containing protein/HPt (histidine-containing phosphotransfer) domain-containing protein